MESEADVTIGGDVSECDVQKSKGFRGHEWNDATSSVHLKKNMNHLVDANRRRFECGWFTWLCEPSLVIQ